MLNLFDDVSNLIDLVKRIRSLSDLRFLNFKESGNERALMIFYPEKREKRVANESRVFLTANPFPYRKFSSFILRNRTIDASLYDTNSFWKRVKNRYPRVEDYTFLSLIFVDTEVPVSVKESSKPSQKVFIRDLFSWNINVFFSKWKRFFQHRKLMTKFISNLSSKVPSIGQIFLKYKELIFLYYRVRFDLFDKIHTKIIVSSKKPRPSLLSIISLSGMDLTTKCLLKDIGYFFIGHLSANAKMPIFSKSHVTFSIKKTCEILHITHLWFGKLHFIINNSCPQRLNSMT